MFRSLLLVTAFLLFTACTTQEVVPNKENNLSKINALSISVSPLIMNEMTTFTWEKAIVLRGDDSEKFQDRVPRVAKSIEQKFISEGYQFSVADSPRYSLAAYILLEGHDKAGGDSESKEHKELLFGLDPGMRSSGDYGMGTLLVAIKSVETGELMWRGAVQILTSSGLSPEQQKARLNNAIAVLFQAVFSE